MGTSVSTLTEVKTDNGDWSIDTFSPFQAQNYGVFAFLANVRNNFMLTPVSFHPGLPEGHESIEQIINLLGDKGFVSRYPYNILEGHYQVHVYLSDLIKFDYDQHFEDLRNYGPGFDHSVEPGKGVMTTYRELLGQKYFDDLESLKNIGERCDVRIILAFESVL
jgi:hypothetical protein